MNRRDIIIVAVLVNTALLAVLFMMAINTDDEKMTEPTEITQMLDQPSEVLLPSASQLSMNPTSPDEGDNALRAFENSGGQPSEIIQEVIEEEPVQDLDQDDDLPPKSEPQNTAPLSQQPVSEPIPATPKPQKSENESPKIIEVTVKRGDSLDKIARVNGSSIKAIKDANQLKNDRLDIGQVLQVPVTGKKAATASSTTSKGTTTTKKTSQTNTQIAGDAQYYTVKSGDSPWKIAKQFNLNLDDLLKLNNLNEEKARNLKAGDKIRIR